MTSIRNERLGSIFVLTTSLSSTWIFEDGHALKPDAVRWRRHIEHFHANNVQMGRIDFSKESYFGSEELYHVG